MARRITDIVAEGEVLGVVAGQAASVDTDQTAAQVPFAPAGTIAATDVQSAIEEVAVEAGDVPPASEVTIADAGAYFTGTDVEAALQELGAAGGGGSGGGLLASLTYNPTTRVDAATTSTTMAALDTTNLRLSFTVPASGAVLVEVNGYVTGGANSGLAWCLLEGGTRVANTTATVAYNTTSGSVAARSTLRVKVTGLTPSASKSWDLAHARPFGSTTVNTNYGGTSDGDPGPITMAVWAA